MYYQYVLKIRDPHIQFHNFFFNLTSLDSDSQDRILTSRNYLFPTIGVLDE